MIEFSSPILHFFLLPEEFSEIGSVGRQFPVEGKATGCLKYIV
jgi:hypothetical protein